MNFSHVRPSKVAVAFGPQPGQGRAVRRSLRKVRRTAR